MSEQSAAPLVQPQLWVADADAAIAFYVRAFGAVVAYSVSSPDGADVVAQLAVGDARFWVATAAESMGRRAPDALGGATARLLLLAGDPEAVVVAALAAGATERSPVADEHGWRLGRVVDPAGHEWEIGHPLGEWPPASG